mmetsp:Transcript_14462/g.25298  ORF Transcript_14462/g.25298 Transcript_14462/m.25298 type:complete len:285 (-) Transcript_14462:13-867(-)
MLSFFAFCIFLTTTSLPFAVTQANTLPKLPFPILSRRLSPLMVSLRSRAHSICIRDAMPGHCSGINLNRTSSSSFCTETQYRYTSRYRVVSSSKAASLGMLVVVSDAPCSCSLFSAVAIGCDAGDSGSSAACPWCSCSMCSAMRFLVLNTRSLASSRLSSNAQSCESVVWTVLAACGKARMASSPYSWGSSTRTPPSGLDDARLSNARDANSSVSQMHTTTLRGMGDLHGPHNQWAGPQLNVSNRTKIDWAGGGGGRRAPSGLAGSHSRRLIEGGAGTPLNWFW